MDLPYNATDPILWVYLEKDGSPVTGIAYNTAGFSLNAYLPGEVAATPVTMIAGTLGTYASNSWVELGQGIYQFCPGAALLLPGKLSLVEFTTPSSGKFKDTLNCVGVGEVIATNQKQDTILSAIGNEADLNFTFTIPGVTPITATGGTLYVKEQGRTISFTADQDLTPYTLELVLEQNGVDVLVEPEANFTKSGNTITWTVPNSFTDEVGSYTWGIRNVANQHFYGSGSFSVVYAPHKDTL